MLASTCLYSLYAWFAFVVLGLISLVLCQEMAGKNISEMTYFVSKLNEPISHRINRCILKHLDNF